MIYAQWAVVAKLYAMKENLLIIFAPKLSDLNFFEDDLSQFKLEVNFPL